MPTENKLIHLVVAPDLMRFKQFILEMEPDMGHGRGGYKVAYGKWEFRDVVYIFVTNPDQMRGIHGARVTMLNLEAWPDRTQDEFRMMARVAQNP